MPLFTGNSGLSGSCHPTRKAGDRNEKYGRAPQRATTAHPDRVEVVLRSVQCIQTVSTRVLLDRRPTEPNAP
jgi:hypothetical protein